MFKAIIPCAGYGTRMGMKPNQSKEILIDPITNKPVIEYSLDLCSFYNLEPLIITRSNKDDLNEYLIKNNIKFIINDSEGEWPESILSSKEKWNENNILLLPDTRFSPHNVIKSIKLNLELGNDCSIAVHKVEDISKWGSINNYFITEKNKDEKPGQAWGIIGFKKKFGYELFSGMCFRNLPFQLRNTSFIKLNKFVDITRTGIIHKY